MKHSAHQLHTIHLKENAFERKLLLSAKNTEQHSSAALGNAKITLKPDFHKTHL